RRVLSGSFAGMTAMAVQTRRVKDDERGMRLDRWFKEHYPALPFGHLQKLLRTGQVRVDGGRVKTHTRLDAGQTIRVPPLDAATLAKGKPSKGAPGKSGAGEGARTKSATERAQAPARGPAGPLKGKAKSDAEFL